MSWQPTPVLGGPNWQGNPPLATKSQLLSTSAGFYTDLKDFTFSTVQVSTLNASIVSLSSLNFKGFDDLLDLDVSFDLGLGQAIGGVVGGLGALVGGGLIAVGTGAGLAIQGAEQGIATMVAGRPQNFISQSNYETINFTSQLQISTLGYDYPNYSSIFRTVSSVAANQVPGREIFTSTIFPAGTTCVRTISDPFNLISGNSNMNTSTIQSYGQWAPFLDPTVAGEDITARNASFSTLSLYTDNSVNIYDIAIQTTTQAATYSNFITTPFNGNSPQNMTTNSNLFMANQTFFSNVNTYVSTPFTQFTSSITTLPGGFYQIPSSMIQTTSLFSWDNPSTDGNFVLALDSLGTKWLSTGRIDIRTNANQSTLLQYGYLVNTYVPQGSTVRLTFDYNASVSSIISRPAAVSTFDSRQLEMVWGFETNPYELQLKTFNQGSGLAATDPGAFQIQASTFVIGANPASSAFNQPGFAYQFNGNTYVGGTLEATSVQTSNLSATVPYQVPFTIETGATNAGAMIGNLNRFYIQTTNGIIFTDVGSYVENASLYLGSNANESQLNVSSIKAGGFIQGNSGFFSSLTVETLTVISTINTTSTNVENITSTATLYANTAYIDTAFISTLDSFTFNTGVGNPSGPFDITKLYTIASTQYTAVSSLTNNILSYTLNEGIQDHASFNMGGQGEGTPPAFYAPTPTNVEQWNSTIIICDPTNGNPATLFLGNTGLWTSSSVTTGTFDLIINQTQRQFYFNCSENENLKNPLNTSSFIKVVPTPGFSNSYRFTLNSNGWWGYVTPAPPPYESYNCNVFQITQDINNVNITTTDRLNFNAGEIVFNGTINLPVANFQTIYTQTIDTNTANVSSILTTANLQASTITSLTINASTMSVNPLTGSYIAAYNKPSTISYNSNPTVITPYSYTFNQSSPDFLPLYTLLAPFQGSNTFTSYNVTYWNNAMFNNQAAASIGPPRIILGDIQAGLGAYSGQFYVNNNIISPPQAIAVTLVDGNVIGTIQGSTYGRIRTTNGTVWQIDSNIANPSGGTYAPYNLVNNFQLQMSATGNYITSQQNINYQAPNISYTTDTLSLFANQIRVNLHAYGPFAQLYPSYRAGMEITSYFDPSMVFSNVPGGSDTWQSDATNPLSNFNGDTYYDANQWLVYINPNRFRCAGNPIAGYDVEQALITVSGAPGSYVWGFNRYIQVRSSPGGPGSSCDNMNIVYAIPRNYCTY